VRRRRRRTRSCSRRRRSRRNSQQYVVMWTMVATVCQDQSRRSEAIDDSKEWVYSRAFLPSLFSPLFSLSLPPLLGLLL